MLEVPPSPQFRMGVCNSVLRRAGAMSVPEPPRYRVGVASSITEQMLVIGLAISATSLRCATVLPDASTRLRTEHSVRTRLSGILKPYIGVVSIS